MGKFTVYVDIETIFEVLGLDPEPAHELKEKLTEKDYLPIRVGVEMDDPYVFLERTEASFETPCNDTVGRHCVVLG